ncbi:MAG TPA: hypothetical protein VFV08_05025, partial [Puia sp.]|nr:hypothetical protein [Puia sp.]
FINNADASTASIAWGNSQLIFDAFELVFNPDPTAMAQFNGKIVTSQSLQTGDPGSGSGVWFLGKEITVASVALVTTKYVETKIDGVIVKLGVVA